MLAYHGKRSIKVKYLNRVISHKKNDQIVQRYGYFKDGKGCAVGCTIHGSTHRDYETELGIPTVLAHLEDRIFEGLPVEEARRWPSRFLRAIEPGADLTKVWYRFAVWLLTDSEEGVIKFARTDRSKASIRAVSDFYMGLVEGRTVTVGQWTEVRSNAYAAHAADAVYAAYAADAAYAAHAADAAYAADAAHAADAVYAAAHAAHAADAAYAAYAAYAAHAADAVYAAAHAAADAVYAAAHAAADASSREQTYIRQSKKLLQLLKEAK